MKEIGQKKRERTYNFWYIERRERENEQNIRREEMIKIYESLIKNKKTLTFLLVSLVFNN